MIYAGDLITIVANNMFVVTELMFLFFIIFWLSTHKKPETNFILHAWLLVAIGYMLRIGYWSVSLMVHDFEPNHFRCNLDMSNCVQLYDPYPSFATEYRWLQIIPAFVVLFGHLMFISFIQGMEFWKKYTLGIAVVAVAMTAALL